MRFPVQATALWAAAVVSIGAMQAPSDLDSFLGVVGARVEAYYARAQSITCTETVHLQPLDADWTSRDFGRTLVYDLRIEWDRYTVGSAPSEPSVVRELRTVNGQPPKPKDKPRCMDPLPVSPDSLAMLLPLHRREYLFTMAGNGRVGKRPARMLDFRGRKPGKADIKWTEDCVSVDLPGHFRGRVWIDAETDDVLRVDEELIGMYEFRVPPERSRTGPSTMIVDRADTTTRYRRVAFTDPDETLMLPESVQTYQVIRNSGVPRLRVTQEFSDYRRFLTRGRVVKPGS